MTQAILSQSTFSVFASFLIVARDPPLRLVSMAATTLGHAGLLRKLLLGEPAVFPPYFERVFADKPALGNFQRHKLVLSALKTRPARIISPHIFKHLRIFHQPLKLFHRNH